MKYKKILKSHAIKLLSILDQENILDKVTLESMTSEQLNNELNARRNQFMNVWYHVL